MNVSFEYLRAAPGFWYVATCYTKHEHGIHVAHIDACKVTAALLTRGVQVFSPIAHSHGIALYGGIDPLSHAIWLPADKPMMDAAHGLIVVKMKNWLQSYGIGKEIEEFRKAGKPVAYLDLETMTCRDGP
jgi:hypothetical protein